MAFFGLTFLGYQEPFQDKKLTLPKYEAPVGTPSPKLDLFYPKLPPIGPAGYDGTVHQGSYERYQEAVKRKKLKKYPNQEYRVPLTCGQDIGWWLPKDQSAKLEDALPWIRVQRHPLLRSPMTKFADSMAVSNPLFSLF
ncbi:sperm microtubule inner protein 11 [Pogona vitticeps]|uniref:Sperm microtubule inner protein 11 n=1 Tax=Pogona vitticeps TaxID=103695 RepID=A0ABM5FNH0_9SAUR